VYVCLCMAITDEQAREAIRAGACTVGQVLRACGTARACGGCTPTLRTLIRERETEGTDVVSINRYREAAR
jgi:bacterioferritin-associated ferredoxin